MSTDNSWQSYDSIALEYERFQVSYRFAQPAADLVALLELPAGGRVLDVGAGTGAATAIALHAAGPEALVVALDASLAMLRVARSKGIVYVVGGTTAGLPFQDGLFDRVVASFILSHCADYGSALSQIKRVLRPGGRLGISTWGKVQDESGQLWQSIAESFVSKDQLNASTRSAIPWDEWFAEAEHVRDALRQSDLADVGVCKRTYHVRMSQAEYLAAREIRFPARFMRQTLAPETWERFTHRVRTVFQARVPDRIEYTNEVLFGLGVKP